MREDRGTMGEDTLLHYTVRIADRLARSKELVSSSSMRRKCIPPKRGNPTHVGWAYIRGGAEI